MTVPHAISWNVTTRCNLRCDHCYLDASKRSAGDDLPTEACLRIVAELAEVNRQLLLIVTGGEPLLRPDLGEIVRAAAGAGMTVVVGTNGTLLSAGEARRLKEAGAAGVGVSVDAALRPGLHDDLRGQEGAFDAAVAALRACRAAGLSTVVQTSVFRWNRDELRDAAELAADVGASAWNVYFLVCTGRGQGLTDLGPDEYEATLHDLRRLQRDMEGRLHVAIRCAPHYRRVVAEDAAPAPTFHAYPSGCPAATSYVRIGPRGEVTPCPYLPSVAGDLTQERFRDIWERAPLLVRLRDRRALGGRCGPCAYRESCGGCRARAFALGGDVMSEDPSCAYRPETEAPSPPEPTLGLSASFSMPWREDARARLSRVPSFLLGLVVRRVEEEARRQRLAEVTPELMQAVRERAPSFAAMAPRQATPSSPESIAWSAEAARRVENAPEFVRVGIRKLVERRAKERGHEDVSSEFLTEIRDESMMRVAQIIRRFGLDALRPEAFAEARRHFHRDGQKVLVLDKIQEFLQSRGPRNQEIREKFHRFIEAAPDRGRAWLPDAQARIDGLPAPLRGEARRAVEEEARRIRAPVVTPGVVDRVMGGAKP